MGQASLLPSQSPKESDVESYGRRSGETLTNAFPGPTINRPRKTSRHGILTLTLKEPTTGIIGVSAMRIVDIWRNTEKEIVWLMDLLIWE